LGRIKSIKDIVDWGLCTGCGACFFYCPKETVSLVNVESLGIRPKFIVDYHEAFVHALSFCPGHSIVSPRLLQEKGDTDTHEEMIGPSLSIWEGYACDEEIRFHGSSGGILTALALYCIEKEEMGFVLHTGMDTSHQIQNKTVINRTKEGLIESAGSRYTTSSPCDTLEEIEKSNRPCVFIGKPCDVAAVNMLRDQRPQLDRNLGLVLTMFCAGTPSTRGTKELLQGLYGNNKEIKDLRYRGEGWPGEFKVRYRDGQERTLSYKQSWGKLQKYRPFRCHLCPDALGELADISSGDAWHRYGNNSNKGLSLIIARTEKGQAILSKARDSVYVHIVPSDAEKVVEAQPVLERRKQLFGRLLAMRLFFIPIPHYRGFKLFGVWRKTGLNSKFRSFAGTSRRLLLRGLWHKNKIL
jgi:coenzyme F420 hydrogenase subunit beta